MSEEFSSNKENAPCHTNLSVNGPSDAIADLHKARWNALIDQMDKTLNEEEKQLKSWLNQVNAMQLTVVMVFLILWEPTVMQQLGTSDINCRREMSCNGMRKVPDEAVPAVNEDVPAVNEEAPVAGVAPLEEASADSGFLAWQNAASDGSGVAPLEEASADSGFLAWQNAASDSSATDLEEVATGDGDPAVEIENGGKREMPPLPDGYYLLEAIRKKRMKKGRAEYLIKWIGYPESDNTWEPYEHLEGCADDVEAFQRGLQSEKGESIKKHKPWKKPRTPKIVVAEPTIVKIIRLVSTQISDDPNAEVLLKFAVLRSDGKEATADNRYMKIHCPQLLFTYYERCMACTYDKETAENEDANNDAPAS